MEFSIVHELPGRSRLRATTGAFNKKNEAAIETLLEAQRGVKKVKAAALTGSILIYFDEPYRGRVLSATSLLTKDIYDDSELYALSRDSAVPSLMGSIALMAARSVLRMMLPFPLRRAVSVMRSLCFVRRGLHSIFVRRKIDVAVSYTHLRAHETR